MANNSTYILYYDGTQFKLTATVPASTTRSGIVELATDAEALAGTDQTRYINSKQVKDNYVSKSAVIPVDVAITSLTAESANSLTAVKYKEVVALTA